MADTPAPAAAAGAGAGPSGRWVRYAEVGMEAFRYIWSTALLLFALAIILYAQITYQIVFYPGVPNWVAIILLFVFLAILGTMEGTMIALTQLRKVDPETYRKTHPYAYNTAVYAYKGSRIERFLNGRQVFVVLCGFQLARLTTPAEGTLGELGGFLQALFTTGLLGSFIVCILGQLTPQIFAAKFPHTFLNLPFLGIVVRLCLLVEFTGITYACWAISRAVVKMAGVPWKSDVTEPQPDDEREASTKRDRAVHFRPLREWLDRFAAALSEAAATAPQTADDDAPSSPTHQGAGTSMDDGAMERNPLATPAAATATAEAAALSEAETDKYMRDDRLPIVCNGRLYASPASLRADLDGKGLWKLSFLRSVDDPLYVPPHIVAAALYAETQRLRAAEAV
jgi:hypothetical protein